MDTNTPETSVPPSIKPEQSAPKTSYGALLGLLVVVAIIVIGAFYFLKERVNEGVFTNEGVGALEDQSASTNPEDISADLEAQSSEDFDKEIDDAFVELDAALETPQ